jgi:hypothetical protein
MSICKASEIPRNEAYIEVRRSDVDFETDKNLIYFRHFRHFRTL